MIISICIIGLFLNAMPLIIGETEKCYVLNSSVILDDTQSMNNLVKSQTMYLDDENEIVLTFSFDSPILTDFFQNGKRYTQVIMDGLPAIGDTGVPMLPVKPVNILLPQKTAVESITVTKGETVVIGDGYNVKLGSKPVTMNAITENTVTESEICKSIRFNSILPYPTSDFKNVGTYNFRGYSFATLVIYPVHYIGQNQQIYYYDTMTVTIKTTESDFVDPLFRSSPVDDMMMREIVDNYCKSDTYVISDPLSFPSSILNPTESYEYIIITNEALKNASGNYTFQDLIQYKIENGISAAIFTVEDIYSNYQGVDGAEKIRNFIKDAYVNHCTEYVLLGGDSDIIPIRKFYVVSDSEDGIETEIISDLYFECLDGSFDGNGNGIWGEPNDGEGGGDVDLVAEVYVGRACAGDSTEVSNFVMKTLSYEQKSESAPYLTKALLAGSYLGFNGVSEYASTSLDELVNGSDAHGYSTVGIPSDTYQIDKLYDSPDYEWSKADLVSRMNSEINIINHFGHGNKVGWAEKIENEDVLTLTNINGSFIYSQACLVGLFDDGALSYMDCFAEYLTVKTCNASFAVIMNANYGWGKWNSTDGPSQRFNREFLDSIFNEGVRDSRKSQLGVANQDSKEDNLWRINEDCMRWCYYELNLFGDPQASLKPIPHYDHDVAVDSIELSENILPGESFELNMTVANQGLSNETNISGTISITEVIDNTTIYEYPWTIDFLASGDKASVEITYILPRGLYRMSADVDSIPEEEILFNNHMNFAVFVGENDPPNKPAKPSGQINGKVGVEYTYSTFTTDPDGDQLYYKWCWGTDPNSGYCMYSNWIGPYESGETINTSHAWGYRGSYSIQVRAKDVYGAISEWSDPLSVSMPVNYQSIKSQPLLLKLLQRFPGFTGFFNTLGFRTPSPQ